jgi:hypothetical protein
MATRRSKKVEESGESRDVASPEAVDITPQPAAPKNVLTSDNSVPSGGTGSLDVAAPLDTASGFDPAQEETRLAETMPTYKLPRLEREREKPGDQNAQMERLIIELPAQVVRKLTDQARENGVPLSEVVLRALVAAGHAAGKPEMMRRRHVSRSRSDFATALLAVSILTR